jgi:putative ABC transport system permease protein
MRAPWDRSGLRRMFRLRPRRAEQVAAEVEDEIALHLELRAEQLERMGLPREQARQEAQRLFGAVDDARRSLRHSVRRREERIRMREAIEALVQDVRYAARRMVRQPGFALAVVVTLALGIGANATMFGIVDRLMIRPPAFLAEPDRTGRIYLARTLEGEETIRGNIGYQTYEDLRENARTIEAVAAISNREDVIGIGDEAHEARTSWVSASFWGFFDAPPALGRYFGPAEDREEASSAVAVLGHGYWQARFGGDPGVLGRQLRMAGRDYTVIGVAPAGFSGTSLEAVAAFIPITAGASDRYTGFDLDSPWYDTYQMTWLEMVARRRPGASPEAVQADLTAAYVRSIERMRSLSPNPNAPPVADSRPRAMFASILAERGPQAGAESRVATWLAGVALLVLLIACANVANLMLARSVQRRREVAVRMALGVSRGRLLAQLLVESLVLALAGGVVGVLLAHWGGGVLRAVMLPDVDFTGTAADPRVLAFTAVAAMLAGLLTGIAPALQLSRPDIAGAVKAGGREGTLHRSRLRSTLLVVQGAVSVVLLVGAALFVRSLHNARSLDLGFDPERVAYVGFSLRGTPLDSVARRALLARMVERAAALPNVESAARTVAVPYYRTWTSDIYVPGVDSMRLRDEYFMNAVSPAYFATVGTRIVRGRGISDADRAGSEPVAVVSQATAQAIWRGEEALGKCMRIGNDTMPCSTVVGVAEDIRRDFAEGPSRDIYLSSLQSRPGDGGLFVRTRGDARDHAAAIRAELQRLMPGTAFVTSEPLQDIVDPSLRAWQLGATMFTIFGVLALVVAAVGLYSVIAYGVAQRTHELGVRIALGAAGRDVVRLILGEGARVALLGILIGVGAALFAGRWVAPLLFEVSPRDPVIFVAIAAALFAIALVASWLPARRASRVDPNVALRAD